MREWMATPPGRVFAIILAFVTFVAAIVIVARRAPDADAAPIPRTRMFVDSVTGKPFPHDLVNGELLPVLAPSGHRTGYPAELCFWTADGSIKRDPTYVLLNERLGKSGPTFCPDCGRLVVGHNPAPGPGMTPPPTRDEYYSDGLDHHADGSSLAPTTAPAH